MSNQTLFLWLLNMLLDTGGQLVFKHAAGAPGDGLDRWRAMASAPWLWLGIACYVGEFLAWTAFLSTVPLSQGVLLGSVNIIIVMVAGRLLFTERLSRLRVAGIFLIAAGVACVGLGA
ncbi:EamA family transporter [Niveispirillum sp.]|uniref:EamA family transporter n=1 Tax=Niveispirillum sp. TaxID=1917217 RepID=UPI001B5B7C2B|nr:EamA family transporter [Niveispirillum sp.]MBP7337713.1 EamA family transporter [Niveispirillum sp.]